MRGRERDIETERKTNGQRDRWKHRGGGKREGEKIEICSILFF